MHSCTCKNATHESNNGYTVCSNCGAVLCVKPQCIEWTGMDDNRQRGELWLTDGTVVGDKQLERFQHGLTNANKYTIYVEGCDFIRNVCNDLKFGGGVEHESLKLFDHVKDHHYRWRGVRRTGLLVACISIACQRLSVGVADATIMKLGRVNTSSKMFNEQKKHVLVALHALGIIIQPADASTYSCRICSDLGLTKQVADLVSAHASKISKLDQMNARSCNTIVAVSILYSIEKYNLCINVNKVCAMMHVTRQTLVKWYAEATGRTIKHARDVIQSFDIRQNHTKKKKHKKS